MCLKAKAIAPKPSKIIDQVDDSGTAAGAGTCGVGGGDTWVMIGGMMNPPPAGGGAVPKKVGGVSAGVEMAAGEVRAL